MMWVMLLQKENKKNKFTLVNMKAKTVPELESQPNLT